MLHWLRVAPIEAIDFLLSFSEKTIGAFVESGFDEDVEEIELTIDGKKVRQYANSRLWQLFRGTSVTPSLLQSLYMALERYLLEVGDVMDPQVTTDICKRLLRNSKHVSATALVASLVGKFPEKLFPIAEILFGTRELFLYDTERKLSDDSAASLYHIPGIAGADPLQRLYVDERIKTCDDNHRKWSLEDIARNYQFFAPDNLDDFHDRQKRIWEILDDHYAALPEESSQNEDDKTWRIYLARIDRRTMEATVKDAPDSSGQIIEFNPTLTPDLREYSEAALAGVTTHMQHVPLRLWARAKFKGSAIDGQFTKYEIDPLQALRETRLILEDLSAETAGERFLNFNQGIPAHVCSVLLRDFADHLSDEDIEF